ncbi:hypothetical protein [Schaalia hyovaginalis]|uniref:hypothetical protein n=1 Tax=Schaalia hyovaginalis TaxID=29316 RepID=UPI001F171828|nr:hypothetical protein [Schaalia hyovaginalis]
MSTQPPTPELPRRRDRVSAGAHGRASENPVVRTKRAQGMLGMIDALAQDDLRRRPGMRLSAFTVMTLSLLAVLTWLISGSAWTLGAVIGLAGIALVLGWSALTGIELPIATTLMLAGTSAVLPVVVAATGDLGNAVPILGIAVVATLAATIFSAPAPREHSLPELRKTEAPEPPAHRRARPQTTTRPTTLSLASAMSLLVLIGGGTAWTAIDVLENWGILVPLTSAIIAVVVWGDQIGRTFRAQSFSALGTGVLTGIATSLLAYQLGRATSLMPIILPGVAQSLGRPVAFAIVGVAAGTTIALAVIVVDGVLGDHLARRPPLGTISRGAAKFLIAAIPIYALVRIGGI